MANQMTISQVREILSNVNIVDEASIAQGNAGARQSIRKIRFDLSEKRDFANPLKLGFPFLSMYVEGASDNQTFVQMKPMTKDDYMAALTLRNKDSMTFGKSINEAFFSWPAQAGKFIDIIFFLDAKFESGSNTIDFNDVSNSITVGGGTMANRFPNVHLAKQFSTPASLLGFNFVYSSLEVLSADSFNSLVSGAYVYQVPTGFELVIENFQLFTEFSDLLTTQTLSFGIVQLLPSVANFDGDAIANIANYSDKYRFIRNSSVVSKVARTTDASIDLANAFNPANPAASAPLDNSNGPMIIQAGRRVAIMALNDTSGTIANIQAYSIEVTGYLRAVL
jgi:hypothetical protein